MRRVDVFAVTIPNQMSTTPNMLDSCTSRYKILFPSCLVVLCARLFSRRRFLCVYMFNALPFGTQSDENKQRSADPPKGATKRPAKEAPARSLRCQINKTSDNAETPTKKKRMGPM